MKTQFVAISEIQELRAKFPNTDLQVAEHNINALFQHVQENVRTTDFNQDDDSSSEVDNAFDEAGSIDTYQKLATLQATIREIAGNYEKSETTANLVATELNWIMEMIGDLFTKPNVNPLNSAGTDAEKEDRLIIAEEMQEWYQGWASQL